MVHKDFNRLDFLNCAIKYYSAFQGTQNNKILNSWKKERDGILSELKI